MVRFFKKTLLRHHIFILIAHVIQFFSSIKMVNFLVLMQEYELHEIT